MTSDIENISQSKDVAKGEVSVLTAIVAIFADKQINLNDLGHLFAPAKAVQDAVQGFQEVGKELALSTNEQSEELNAEFRKLQLKDKKSQMDAQEILIGIKAIARLICRSTYKKEDIETASDGLPENVNVA